MSDTITCDSCGQELEVQKDFGIKERGLKQKKYRIRRFHCELCNVSKTLFNDGFKDENFHPPHFFRNPKEMSDNNLRTPSTVTYV